MSLKRFLLLAVILAWYGKDGYSQSSTCSQKGTFTAVANGTTLDNRLNSTGACINWRLTYSSTGLSALSIAVQGAPDSNGTAGTFVTISSTFVTQGSNPSTLLQAETALAVYYPWMRVIVSTFTSSGTITYNLNAVNATIVLQRSNSGGGSSGGVASFNARTGVVVPVAGDYTCADVTGCTAAGSIVNSFNGRTGTVLPANNDYSYSQISGTPTIYNQTIQDESTPLTQRSAVNFTGAGVSCADTGGVTVCTIGGGVTQAYTTIAEEASDLTQRSKLNFIGSNINCVDNAGATRTDCTVSGGSAGTTTTYGAIASLPTAGNAGAVYIPSDSYYAGLYDSGAAWIYRCFDGQTCTIPNSASFTSINTPGASVQTNGAITITSAAGANDNVRSYVLTAYPGTPFNKTFRIKPLVAQADFPSCGVVFRESGTGKLTLFQLNNKSTSPGSSLQVNHFTNLTTYSATAFNWDNPIQALQSADYETLRVGDDGTNLTFAITTDGVHFLTVFSELRGAFFTTAPDQVGVYVNSNNATFAASCTLVAVD